MGKLRKSLCVLVLFSLVFSHLSAESFYNISETQLTKIEQELRNSKESLMNSNQRIEELSNQLENSNLTIETQSQELMKLSEQFEKSEKSNKFKTKLLTISITTNLALLGSAIIVGLYK